MKSISQLIKEAKNPKPSGLSKFKQGSVEKVNTYLGGDVYDSVSGTYTQTDKYYKGDGDGYIMDKSGNVYDVNVEEWTEDAGRIAGGRLCRSVTIKRVGPENTDLGLSGYSGCFSSPSSDTWGSLVSDIKNGMYLEDYLAKHQFDMGYSVYNKDWVKKLIDAGDKNAKTAAKAKEDAKIEKEQSFNARYIALNKDFPVWIKEGTTLEREKVSTGWSFAEIKPSKTKNDKKSYSDRDSSKKLEEEAALAIYKQLLDLAEGVVKKAFGNAKLDHCGFDILMTSSNSEGYPAWDTKKNKLVIANWTKRRILEGEIILSLGTCLKLRSPRETNGNSWYTGSINHLPEGYLTPFTEKLFNEMGSKIKKNHKKGDYVEANWELLRSQDRSWTYHSPTYWKRLAGQQFEKMKGEFDITSSKFSWIFPMSIVNEVMEGNFFKKAKGEVKAENPSEETATDTGTQEVTSGPTKPKRDKSKGIKVNDKVYAAQKEKMEKWHDGTRKQNLKNCNDGKLKLNYSICKELGYEKECQAIEKEAESRGLALEGFISLKEKIQMVQE